MAAKEKEDKKKVVGQNYPWRALEVSSRLFSLIDMAHGETDSVRTEARSEVITNAAYKGDLKRKTCEDWKGFWRIILDEAKKALEEED